MRETCETRFVAGYEFVPRDVVDRALDDVLEPAATSVAADPRWSSELAIDLLETKGETHVVHRLFHAVLRGGGDARLEDKRCDLVVELDGWDVKLEAKTVHLHQLLNGDRVDGGFRSFQHRTRDLDDLRSGAADVLLGIVPRFRTGVHRKYPAQVGQHELAPFPDDDDETLTAKVTQLGEQFAAVNGIQLRRRTPVQLVGPGELVVDATLAWFVRRRPPSNEGSQGSN